MFCMTWCPFPVCEAFLRGLAVKPSPQGIRVSAWLNMCAMLWAVLHKH